MKDLRKATLWSSAYYTGNVFLCLQMDLSRVCGCVRRALPVGFGTVRAWDAGTFPVRVGQDVSPHYDSNSPTGLSPLAACWRKASALSLWCCSWQEHPACPPAGLQDAQQRAKVSGKNMDLTRQAGHRRTSLFVYFPMITKHNNDKGLIIIVKTIN